MRLDTKGREKMRLVCISLATQVEAIALRKNIYVNVKTELTQAYIKAQTQSIFSFSCLRFVCFRTM